METTTPTTAEDRRWNGSTLKGFPTAPERSNRLCVIPPSAARPRMSYASWLGEDQVQPRAKAQRSCFTSFVRHLRERKVVQWTAAYIAMAFVILQSMDVVSDAWEWPNVAQQAASLLLGFGILPALVVAWFHGEKGRQEICAMEATIVAVSIMGSVFAVWSFCLGTTA